MVVAPPPPLPLLYLGVYFSQACDFLPHASSLPIVSQYPLIFDSHHIFSPFVERLLPYSDLVIGL